MFDGLDADYPLHIKLGEKYNVSPTVIAYLRAAMLEGKYDKESLIFHIIEENIARKEEIQKLKNTITEQNIDERREHIAAIQKKVDFRQAVMGLLRTIEESHLRDILQHE